MKKTVYIFFAAWVISAVTPTPIFPQGFGKNKVQYQRYRWQYIQSEHYDIYFYENGLRAAQFTAAVAESSYKQISQQLDFKMMERTPILVYNSHNDFEETNVSPEIQEESVGGFTEFFKNRVVFPYEGSAEQFRHVIHHELVHAMHLQFFYGTGAGAAIRGVSGFTWPLWYGEGHAEYFSLHYDTETDNFMRDAVVSGYLPPVSQLDAFLAYKGGQALLYWIENRFGVEKVTELNHSLRRTRNIVRTTKEVFGMSVEDFSEAWHHDLREEYWPEIARRTAPINLATPITDHVKNFDFINNSPALSPSGDRIVYLSDNSGKFDIYVASALEPGKPRRLISGQKQSGLEELKWLRPGITWSPDSKQIAFAAKAGDYDAIHIVDMAKGKIIRTYKPQLEGLWSPAWSPDGKTIAFMGMKAGHSDIFLLNLQDGSIMPVTKDAFSDLDPAWSPDGKWIAFVSDRGAFSQPVGEVLPLADYANTDIFLIQPDGAGLQQLTSSLYTEKSPTFFHNADSLLFVSDRNGIDNIYLFDLARREERPLTNLLSGANQLSASIGGDRVAFTSFSRGGYDVYLWKAPFEHADSLQTLPLTSFREREKKQRELSLTAITPSNIGVAATDRSERPYKDFAFDHDFRAGKVDWATDGAGRVVVPPEKRLAADGSYKIQPYRNKFSIDYIGGAGGYDPFFGLQAYTQLYLSDLAGNHQIGLGLNIVQDISNSDLILTWGNIASRPEVGVQLFHFFNFFQTSLGIVRSRYLGVGTTFNYPLSRFKRLELSLNVTQIREEFLQVPLPTRVTNAFPLTTLAYVSDNTLFRYFGPFTGRRYRLSVITSPNIGSNAKSFFTGVLDYRHYFGITRDIGFAWRLSGGASSGKNPMRFLLGGMDNWLNYQFAQDLNALSIADFYFSNFITPLRGADYYESVGTRYFLFNAELRFPLVDYFITRFPLPLGIAGIRGAGFVDAGSAWESDKHFRALKKGKIELQDVIMAYGWGFRAYLGFILLRMDVAWRTDLQRSSKPRYLFSFGTDF